MALLFSALTGTLEAVLNAADAVMVYWLAATRLLFPKRLVEPPSARPSVVIVGASFAGLACQRLLSDDFNVTLVDYKAFFEYTPGVLRLFVQPSHFANVVKPLPCRRNRVLVAEVVEVRPSELALVHRAHHGYNDGGGSGDSGSTCDGPGREETLHFDYLVVACGSGYPVPVVKAQSGDAPDLSSRRRAWVDAAAALAAARRVVVVGGGAVGVELVAEFAAAHAHLPQASTGNRPFRSYTLVSRAPTLLPALPKQAGVTALAWLRQHSCVSVLLGVGAASMRPDGVTLDDGTELEADVVFNCGGATAKPNDILKAHFGDCLDPLSGRLMVNDHLQVLVPSLKQPLPLSSQRGDDAVSFELAAPDSDTPPAVFAAGDCLLHPSGELQLGHTAELNAHVAAENIKLLASHRARLQRQSQDQDNLGRGCSTAAPRPKDETASTAGNGPTLLTYPRGAHGLAKSPQVFCVSLGPRCAVLCFNGLVLRGWLPALMKWLIEWTKVCRVLTVTDF
jgi:NADH dehydrogenase FAD-containing subunit